MPSPTEITTAQLSRLIGLPHCPVLIDVSIDADFSESPYLIPGAKRHPAQDIAELVPQLIHSSVVIICQKGKKMSQGAAAILRHHGIQAETLAGGNQAWHDAKLPMISAASMSTCVYNSHSVWVTKQRPKVDRIACPWLIRRFVDSKAQFLFVSSSEVLEVASKFNATAFDVEGSLWSHRGDQCSFDTMLEEFKLSTPALHRLANIVRGADTNCLDLTPQSAGLLAASLGYSRMYKNDLEQLEASMPLYDALYRWCRDAVEEDHDSNSRLKKD